MRVCMRACVRARVYVCVLFNHRCVQHYVHEGHDGVIIGHGVVQVEMLHAREERVHATDVADAAHVNGCE